MVTETGTLPLASAVAGSLPLLRFGARYRMRARAVDLAGNSLEVGDALADTLALSMGLPADPEGRVYLRYEPVAAPLVSSGPINSGPINSGSISGSVRYGR